MAFYDEIIQIRLRARELTAMDYMVIDDRNLESRSDFVRVAILKELRNRGYKHGKEELN